MASTKELFANIEAKYRLPSGYLARSYQLESRSGTDLYNPKSKAAGPFQFLPSTAKKMGLEDPYDLEASADATARLAVQNREDFQRRGIENPDGKMLYLAHQQGAAGAASLLGGGETPAVAALGKVYGKDKEKVAQQAVVNNGGSLDISSSDFAGQIMAKYEGKDVSGGVQQYSALGTSAPLNELNTGDVLEESAPAEEGNSSRKDSYAMNALLSASNALQQQPAPMLPIPRLSYAEGGIASVAKNPYADRPGMFGKQMSSLWEALNKAGMIDPNTGNAYKPDHVYTEAPAAPSQPTTAAPSQPTTAAPSQPTTAAPSQPTTNNPSPAYIQSPITFPTTATPPDFSGYSINPTTALNMPRKDKRPALSVQDLYPFIDPNA